MVIWNSMLKFSLNNNLRVKYNSIFEILIMKNITLFLSLAVFASLTAQNIKDEKVSYQYVKLPSNPIAPKPANYTAVLVSTADAENARLLANYEAEKIQAETDYQRELAEYDKRVKAAEDQYAKDMEAYNSKSTAAKIVERQLLNENSKPVKQYVAVPSKRYLSEPKLFTVYDASTLASTYLKIDGFERSAAGEIQYIVEMKPFEYSSPRMVSEIRKETSVANGKSNTYDVTYYHLEFEYRQPMTVKVLRNNSQEIYFEAPAKLMEFTKYRTDDSKNSPSMDVTVLVKNMESQMLKQNLEFINHLVNDRIGFEVSNRTTVLEYVKSKKGDYDDLMNAFDVAKMGYTLMNKSDVEAKAKIGEAVSIWKKALEESDIANKKARIDEKVTISVCFNLLEGHFALRQVEEAEGVMAILKKMDLSRKETKLLESYTQEFLDLKIRKIANNL